MFTEKEQQILLDLAKKSLTYYLENSKFLNAKKLLKTKLNQKEFKKLSQKCGVFVTLQKGEELRGCIGTIESDEPIYKGVVKNSVSAGLEDDRFSPVEKDELPQITFEISVLTKPKKIKSLDEIEIGKHGVIIKQDNNKAVYLPQVAPEWGWNKAQLLESLCEKAGLKKDDYKEKDVVLEIFEANVFGEK